MISVTTKPEIPQPTTGSNSHLFDDWCDPIETGIRDRVRGLIEVMICGELDAALSRPRYGRCGGCGWQRRCGCCRPSAWPPGTHADGDFRQDRDRRAACSSEHRRRQDDGMKKPGEAPVGR